jgi:D-lactate dehydrogenase (cytochrome)
MVSTKPVSKGKSWRAAVAIGFVTGSLCGFYWALNSTLANPPEFLFPHSSSTRLNDLPSPSYGTQWDFDLALEKLKELLPEDAVSATQTDIEHHTTNNYTLHAPEKHQRPRVILYPSTTEQVVSIMKVAHEYQIPIVPYGGGTSIEGQYISTRRGITLDLSRMNKVIRYNKDDLDITVEAGVGWQEINELVGPDGLMLGPDPGPGASCAGMVACSCSGTNASRYGTMKENVVNLTVVLPDGQIIKTKRRPKKSSNGYNLTGLFIGSEGTLGVVTEATLKLHVKSKYETIAVVPFRDIGNATKAVTKLIQEGITVNAVELLDERMMKAINFSGQTSKKWEEKPTLFFKVGSGNQKILNEIIKDVKQVTKEFGSQGFQVASNQRECDELWSARKSIFWSSIDYGRATISPDVKVWSTDVAVPISNLSKVIDETVEDCDRSGLYTTIVGHVGDGNFHCLLMYDKKDEPAAMALADRMVERSLKYEGTCSGEHGIGTSKRHHLVLELGEDTIDVMRKLKMSLDPLRIMNPDKVFKIDPQDKAK